VRCCQSDRTQSECRTNGRSRKCPGSGRCCSADCGNSRGTEEIEVPRERREPGCGRNQRAFRERPGESPRSVRVDGRYRVCPTQCGWRKLNSRVELAIRFGVSAKPTSRAWALFPAHVACA